MTYAITACFDNDTAKLLFAARSFISQELSLPRNPSDDYEPHITLAILEPRGPSTPFYLAEAAGVLPNEKLRCSFAGLGLFPTVVEDKLKSVVFINLVPSFQLLTFHSKLHAQLRDPRRDQYYDPGKWLPHVTLLQDVPAEKLQQILSSETLRRAIFRTATLTRLESTYTKDATTDVPTVVERVRI